MRPVTPGLARHTGRPPHLAHRPILRAVPGRITPPDTLPEDPAAPPALHLGFASNPHTQEGAITVTMTANDPMQKVYYNRQVSTYLDDEEYKRFLTLSNREGLTHAALLRLMVKRGMRALLEEEAA